MFLEASYIDNYEQISQLVYDAKIRAGQIIEEANAERDKILNEARRNAEETNAERDKILNEARRSIEEANAERDRILSAAKRSADAQLDKAQIEMDDKIREGRQSYAVIQNEIAEMVQLANKVQKRFIQAFKAIHEISDEMGGVSFEDAEDDDPSFDDFEPLDNDSAEEASPEDESRFLKEAMAIPDDGETS